MMCFLPTTLRTKTQLFGNKLKKGEGKGARVKDCLSFGFDGEEKAQWLEISKRDALITIVDGWLGHCQISTQEILFESF